MFSLKKNTDTFQGYSTSEILKDKTIEGFIFGLDVYVRMVKNACGCSYNVSLSATSVCCEQNKYYRRFLVRVGHITRSLSQK